MHPRCTPAAPPRYAALRANCHAEQKRGGLSWSACKASAEREHPRATLRYARTAMRNKSGACPRGARAIAARNESTPRAPLRSAHYHAACLGRSAPIHAACLGRSVPLALPSAPIHAARPRSPPRRRRRPIGGRLPLLGVGGAFCTTTAPPPPLPPPLSSPLLPPFRPSYPLFRPSAPLFAPLRPFLPLRAPNRP